MTRHQIWMLSWLRVNAGPNGTASVDSVIINKNDICDDPRLATKCFWSICGKPLAELPTETEELPAYSRASHYS